MLNRHHAYKIAWSSDDGQYIASCLEFPSLSWLDEDEVEAMRGIRDLVAETVQDMIANGEDVPEPIMERNYSGQFVIRTTPDMHRRLVLEAAEARVSLNRYVNAKLAAGGR